MKLLGLRLCEHDSNISYFDGSGVHYYKSERHFQQKHHAFGNLHQWKDIIKELWDIDHEELDDIAIVVDPQHHNIECDNQFPSSEFNYLCTKTPCSRLNHHYAHALSAWMMPPSSVQIIIDGFGDEDIAWTVFRDNKIVESGSMQVCGSIGMNMSTVGYNIGMTNCHGLDIAGKLMGLQSYGSVDNGFKQYIKQYGVRESNDIFDYSNWIEYKKDKLLADLTKLNWITTIHAHIGEKLVEFFSEFADEQETIVYSGGVAQNVIWNTALKQKFKNLVIPPHCADDGLSLGALEFLRNKHNLPKFNLDKFPYCQSDESPLELPTDEVYSITAKLLSQGKIIAWYQDNGELGPRALGNRSILMDPRIVNGKDKINSVKKREFYRPFGASVLSEYRSLYFKDLPDNPHMLYIAYVKENYPSITHVDGTCRAQTVDSHTTFGKLLVEFHKLTGCAVLLNTSLNIAGKPIAGFKQDAMTLFKTSSIDALVIGNHVYIKE